MPIKYRNAGHISRGLHAIESGHFRPLHGKNPPGAGRLAGVHACCSCSHCHASRAWARVTLNEPMRWPLGRGNLLFSPTPVEGEVSHATSTRKAPSLSYGIFYTKQQRIWNRYVNLTKKYNMLEVFFTLRKTVRPNSF